MKCDVENLGFALTLGLGAFLGVLFCIVAVILLVPQPYGRGPMRDRSNFDAGSER